MPNAARVTDDHSCPLHTGGRISSGADFSEIVNERAARLIDRARCVLATDTIAQGSSTVLIDRLPASREDDESSHGGTVTTGADTVDIGGDPVTIVVAGNAAFARQVQDALATILPTRSGVEWMQQMAENGRAVTIAPISAANGNATPDSFTDAANGTGTGSTIGWDPTFNPLGAGQPGAVIVLAHEMVHSLHMANGTMATGPIDTFPGAAPVNRNEERSTVGTSGPVTDPTGAAEVNPPDYSSDVPTENSFRDDLGVDRRDTYFPPTWPGGPPY